MASAYGRAESIRASVERRGITFRVRAAEIIRNVPKKARDLPDGMQALSADAAGSARTAPAPKEFAAHELELRRECTRALVNHARAIGDIFAAQDAGGKARAEQLHELKDASKAFDEMRPHGSTDAEAA